MRHRHILLRLLKLRIIVNEHDIYECKEKQPVIIPCTGPVTKFIVTNGFHSSRMVTVKYKPEVLYYEVESFLDNIQILTGLFMTIVSFCIFILTGLRLFMFFANCPLLIMLYVLYVRRKSFILVHSLKPGIKIS